NPYAFGYKGIYDPYSFNPFYNPYNPYSHYGNYGNYYSGHYGSYYPPVVIVPGGRVNTNTGPRRVNLVAYNNTSGSNYGVRPNNSGVRSGNATAPRTTTAPVRSFKRSNETGVGNVMRRVFTPSQSNSNSNNQRSQPRRNNNSNMDTRSS